MSEAEFKKKVVEAYDRLMDAGLLKPNLEHYSPARLKSEAMLRCGESMTAKDLDLLRDFFGKKDSAIAYQHAIKNASAEKFRPLVNFLDDRKINTQHRNIQLLAWLMDFQPSVVKTVDSGVTTEEPGEPATDQDVHQDTKQEARIPEDQEDVSGKELTVSIVTDDHSGPGVKEKNGYLQTVWIALVVLAAGSLVYWLWMLRPPADTYPPVTGSEKCMIWTGDYYRPFPCDRKRGDTLIVPLNENVMQRFKRITKPDTLTRYSLGRVWYHKSDNHYEFFTDSGRHPVDSNKRLRPLKEHILIEHTH